MRIDDTFEAFADFAPIVDAVDDAITHLSRSIHSRLNSGFVRHKAHKSITSLAQSLAINNGLLY